MPRPANHVYPTQSMGLALQMFLQAAVSFRGCSAVVELVRGLLPQFPSVPAANTVQSWLLRVGLHELTRPKEQADDWVLIIDHTLQLGTLKCLLIVGIRQSAWERLDQPLAHHDLTFLGLEPMEKSDGEQVCQQLEAVAEQVGQVRAILNDHGSDLVKGVAKFAARHPRVRALQDVAHQAAIVLKQELLADPRWEAFVKHCGQTQPRVKQTELGHLAPPTQKVKGRYMNLGPLIGWGAKMLRLVETPAAERPGELKLARLQEKFGWIQDFREALVDWNDLQAVKDCVLPYARGKGYHLQAADELRTQLAEVARTAPGRRMAEALVEFVAEQARGLQPGESLPASSEVLESLIGKGKRMQGQHSRGGFTKMILGMAASVTQLTEDGIRQALEAVREVDLRTWLREHLGVSLTAQRRQALPALAGTKTG